MVKKGQKTCKRKSKILQKDTENKKQRIHFFIPIQGLARTQSPTTKNYAPELPTFGVIARVSPTEVQWKGLAPGQVSMLDNSVLSAQIRHCYHEIVL